MAWTDGKVGTVANSAAVQVRRVYDEPEDGNGCRVLSTDTHNGHRHIPCWISEHPFIRQSRTPYR